MFSHFFIERPIFATVLSIVVVIIGSVSVISLPVDQYPNITPPTVQVKTSYPGASAKVVADTVAAPIEQEINGVEDMLYMVSKSTNDGQLNLDITFKVGTDLNMAQVLTQNRVAIAQPKLPEEVNRQGVTTKKKSPSILLCINLVSPDGRYDELYMSNYATIQIKDAIARIVGVGDVQFIGQRDYSMRIWIDPERLASRNMTAGDVSSALREQNIQVAAGRIGQPPVPPGTAFDLTLNTLGRLLEPEEFAEIIVKTGENGELTRVRDIGRVELGAKNYEVNSYLDGAPSTTLTIFQLPGSNALDTAAAVKAKMEELKKGFPAGLDYRIVYDTTIFVEESITEVWKTLFEAFALVFLVLLVFLQNWRSTIIPLFAVPVALIGTFFIMQALGFTLNNLSLFGLVLAIGVVVDDAIVVVESVERNMSKGMEPKEAARKTMTEIFGALIATTLVLCAVFVPTGFITGISGQFYKQFALTIAAATLISSFNAITLSPALCGVMLKPRQPGERITEVLPWIAYALLAAGLGFLLLPKWGIPLLGIEDDDKTRKVLVTLGLVLAPGIGGALLSPILNRLFSGFFGVFNWVFDKLNAAYGAVVSRLLRVSPLMMIVYGGFLFLAYLGFTSVPVGFIPDQDKGYMVVNAQLPDGASLERSQKVSERITEIALSTHGVAHTISMPGYSPLLSTNLPNVAGMFVVLEDFVSRKGDDSKNAFVVAAELRKKFSDIQEAVVTVFNAPAVEGMGSTGGFKLYVQDRGDLGLAALQAQTDKVVDTGNQQPGLVGLFTSFRASQPQLYIELDRTQAKGQGVTLDDVFETLQTYLGSAYVNDFTRFGRNWQVTIQAEPQFRLDVSDVGKLKVRNRNGDMVPLGAVLSIRDMSGPAVVTRYNLYPAADISGATAPGTSSGQGISLMEQACDRELPTSMSKEWTEITLQQILAGNTAVFTFILGTVFVFLVLAAQYESWSMPMSIILIVPMCLTAAIAGVWLCKMDNNIFTQIGLVVLVGLSAKNAILIVEFAKQLEDEGKERREAIVEACRMRLRPILMTALTFGLGVLPLVTAQGAGAEMRVALGVAVFAGMNGVTVFGLFFTPIFYDVVRGLANVFGQRDKTE